METNTPRNQEVPRLTSRKQSYISETNRIQPETRRWFILLGFSLLNFSNQMASSVYSLNIDEIEQYYGVGTSGFLQLSNIYNYIYVIMCLPFSSFIRDHFAACMMISTSLNTLGGFLRWYAKNDYALALLGQGVSAISQGCILQIPGVITENWFPASERMWSLLIGTYAGYLGVAFGNITPCYYFTLESVPKAISTMFVHQLIIVIVPTVVLALVVRNKPKHPPNLAYLLKEKAPEESLLVVMKQLFSNKRYIYNILCIGFAIGVGNTITTVTSFILDDINYSNLRLSYIGTAFLVTGMIGAIAGNLYLEMKKSINYDAVLRASFLIGFLALVPFHHIGLAISRENKAFSIFLILNGIAGLGYISFTPFAIESILETTYPLPESIAVGIALILAQIFSLILIVFSTLDVVGYKGYWILSIASLPATIYVLFKYKTVFKRTQIETESSAGNPEEAESLLNSLLEKDFKYLDDAQDL